MVAALISFLLHSCDNRIAPHWFVSLWLRFFTSSGIQLRPSSIWSRRWCLLDTYSCSVVIHGQHTLQFLLQHSISWVSLIFFLPPCQVFSSRQALNGHARVHGGTNQVTKPRCTVPGTKQKSGTQSGYCSIKSSPAHSTTSGETDPTTIFPCKECGK